MTPSRLDPLDLSLDEDWEFAYSPEAGGDPPVVPEESAFAISINVPGYWDDQVDRMKSASWWSQAQFNPDYRPIHFPLPEQHTQMSLPYLIGVGWYRRVVDVPADWSGGRVTLTVGGAVMDTYVYVNGSFIHHHRGHNTPFEIDLTDHLDYGHPNELAIAVSNLDRSMIGGCALNGHQGYTAGIYRSVNLHVSGPGRICSLFLRPVNERSTVRWWADLSAPHGSPGETCLRWRIRSLDGEVLREGEVPVRRLDAGERYRMEWDIPAEGLEEWSCWNSQRYLAEVEWVQEAAVWDRVEQAFGLRELVRDGKRLRLNGRPIMLRGVCDHHSFGQHATAPLSIDYYRDMIRRLQEVGYNFIRCHTWVPSPEYMQAADELGMLLHVELMEWHHLGQNSPPPEWPGHELWREIIQWSRVHPSVVIYSLGNEQLLDEQNLTFREQAYAEAKELDPGALVMPQEGMRGIEYVWNKDEIPPELLTPEPFPHNAERLARITKCADVFGQYPLGKLSYSNLQGDWRELEQWFAIYERPLLSHEVGIIGCYLNLDLESRYTGRMPPDLYTAVRDNLVAADRLHMAQRYYQNSARWQSLTRKYNLEVLRKCDSIAGFDHLGGWDSHWLMTGYACGTLNEFFELKYGGTARDILRYNGESVVLLDNGLQHSFWAGDTFSMNVMVSLYGGKPLENGLLEWRLVAGDQTLLAGEMKDLHAPDGVVTDLGPLAFEWPNLETASKVMLQVTLSGSGYDIANQWDFWSFPRQAPPECNAAADEGALQVLSNRYAGVVSLDVAPDSQMRIVSELTAEHIAHLQSGGDVLLLGADPFPAHPTSFQMSLAGRSNGDLATIVNEHDIFTYLPHEGYCDWQFQPLLNEGRCVVFNELPIEFNPILEVVSSYKEVRLQAAIWEAQTEGGRLLVASCNFDMNDPASVALLDGIIGCVSSDGFRPQTKVAINEVLKPLVNGSGQEYDTQ